MEAVAVGFGKPPSSLLRNPLPFARILSGRKILAFHAWHELGHALMVTGAADSRDPAQGWSASRPPIARQFPLGGASASDHASGSGSTQSSGTTIFAWMPACSCRRYRRSPPSMSSSGFPVCKLVGRLSVSARRHEDAFAGSLVLHGSEQVPLGLPDPSRRPYAHAAHSTVAVVPIRSSTWAHSRATSRGRCPRVSSARDLTATAFASYAFCGSRTRRTLNSHEHASSDVASRSAP
jgi:hypothetical protein